MQAPMSPLGGGRGRMIIYPAGDSVLSIFIIFKLCNFIFNAQQKFNIIVAV
jgi:hypothetical protein